MPELKSPRLEVKGLTAAYGPSQVLHGVDFTVADGEIVSLIGRNGAGKTTTLRSIMGLMRKREGSVKIEGHESVSALPEEIARRGLAYCPEERGIFASLSVAENLELPPIIGPGGWTTEAIYRRFPNLYERRRSGGTQLSGGEQQMLALARLLRTGSRFLLLDEPTEGLAPVIVDEIGSIVNELKAAGYTILVAEQSLAFVLRHADRHLVLEQGRIVAEVSQRESHADLTILQRYLSV